MPRFHNINGEEVQFTETEELARDAEEAAWVIKKAKDDKLAKRQAALATKWPDPFALLDDILERGIDTVKTERNALKQANPKGE